MTATEEPEIIGVNVFPNPSDQTLHISGRDIISYSIYNVDGALIRKSDYFENSIDIRRLDEGLYSLVLVGKKGLSKSVQFVKL